MAVIVLFSKGMLVLRKISLFGQVVPIEQRMKWGNQACLHLNTVKYYQEWQESIQNFKTTTSFYLEIYQRRILTPCPLKSLVLDAQKVSKGLQGQYNITTPSTI